MKKVKPRIQLSDVLKCELQDAEFEFYFTRAKAIHTLAKMIRDARLRAGMTQIELAQRAKTTQAVIARLESGADQRTPSLDLLDRIASAVKAKLLIRFDYRKAA